jgi:hypothetical protein
MTSLVLPGSLSLSTRPKNPNSQVSGSRAEKRVLNWFAAAETGNFQDPFQLKKRDKLLRRLMDHDHRKRILGRTLQTDSGSYLNR